MINLKANFRIAGAALLSAAALAGCNDNPGNVPSMPAAPQPAIFSGYVMQIFRTDADATPVSVDVELNFDVDNDPTAFDGLLT